MNLAVSRPLRSQGDLLELNKYLTQMPTIYEQLSHTCKLPLFLAGA